MARTIDVAIVGAGPYGLSLAAHLRDTGLTVRIFGRPMALWRSAMPAGMQLKSQPYASNLSDPAGAATLKAYCAHRGEEYVPYGKPVRLADFTAYGGWFQRTQVPDLTETLVRRIASVGEQFEVTLDDGETLLARRVVVAVGVEHFDRMPPLLAELPGTLVTHSSAHTDLSRFAGTDLTVLGGGSRRWRPRRSPPRPVRGFAWWCARRRSPGTVIRCGPGDRCGYGCGSRRRRWGPGGPRCCTRPSRICCTGCRPGVGPGSPAPRWDRPARTGCGRGWRAGCRCSPTTN
ncbi:NAD(P)-binding domain-containing protein [Actinocatenispora sera]|uniref:Uncharacterized protein n=1 Tax=Actinocatenispora sera TaxID=390989 RepID=A0A810LBC5_9ACTN|nr:NAD(P)-binding domain-containing protein [Actinocatenispora sera]BCJ31566.1 hypothetical protein Asera_56740 [Actinocatenispora sera]